MTVKQFLKSGGNWEIRCDTKKPYRAMTVNVGFISSGNEDEVQFDIQAYNKNELSELFNEFCKENGYCPEAVTYIHVVQTAETIEQLK